MGAVVFRIALHRQETEKDEKKKKKKRKEKQKEKEKKKEKRKLVEVPPCADMDGHYHAIRQTDRTYQSVSGPKREAGVEASGQLAQSMVSFGSLQWRSEQLPKGLLGAIMLRSSAMLVVMCDTTGTYVNICDCMQTFNKLFFFLEREREREKRKGGQETEGF